MRCPRILVTLAWLLAAATVTAAQSRGEVKIGVILPLSGAVAPTGGELRRGLDFATAEINANGGIRSLGGARLTLVYGDSRGMPETGMSEAERLILRENVAALMGAFQSSVTMTSSEVAERYAVPYLVLVSVAPGITQRGFHWTFRATEEANVDTRVQMDYLTWLVKRSGLHPRTVALVSENSEWGETVADLTRKFLPAGYEVVLDERYTPGTSDFNAIAEKLHRTRPDVIFLASYVADGILLTRALAERHVTAMAILTRGAEHGDPAYHAAVGDLGDYQSWMVPFHPAESRRQPWMEPILAEYRRRSGAEMTPYAATAYANLYILSDALERAGSMSHEKIRAALAATKITSGRAMLLPYPSIEFDEHGQNPNTTLPVIQTVRGTDYIVFPRALADISFQPVFPLPGWGEHPATSSLLQPVVNGVTTGGVYALFALGLSLVFGVMRIINFAHGSILMLGMFAAYWMAGLTGAAWWHALAAGALLFIVGYAIQRLFLNSLLAREPQTVEPVSALLVTLGLALVLDNAALLIFGADYVSVPAARRTLHFGSVLLDSRRLAVLCCALALTFGLALLLKRTRVGLAFRAVAQDRDAAALQGINVNHTYALAFGVGAATAGIAAALIAPLYYVHPTVGTMFLIKGYLVVVLGGMASLRGTLAAALVVGVLEAVLGQLVSANVADASVFVLFILVLLVRPSGLAVRRAIRA